MPSTRVTNNVASAPITPPSSTASRANRAVRWPPANGRVAGSWAGADRASFQPVSASTISSTTWATSRNAQTLVNPGTVRWLIRSSAGQPLVKNAPANTPAPQTSISRDHSVPRVASPGAPPTRAVRSAMVTLCRSASGRHRLTVTSPSTSADSTSRASRPPPMCGPGRDTISAVKASAPPRCRPRCRCTSSAPFQNRVWVSGHCWLTSGRARLVRASYRCAVLTLISHISANTSATAPSARATRPPAGQPAYQASQDHRRAFGACSAALLTRMATMTLVNCRVAENASSRSSAAATPCQASRFSSSAGAGPSGPLPSAAASRSTASSSSRIASAISSTRVVSAAAASAGSAGAGRVSTPGGTIVTSVSASGGGAVAAGAAARCRTRISRCDCCGGSAKWATLYSMNGANSSQHAEASGASVSPPHE